jgi:3-oxoacyl-[acyl-carrier-protein] synthase II
MLRRVAVTGVGVVSPVGLGRDAFWRALKAGASGITGVTRFDASALPSRVAGEVHGFTPTEHLELRDVLRTDTFVQYALVAAREALDDAKLTAGPPRTDVGVCIGTGMGGISLLLTAEHLLMTDGPGAISPYLLPAVLPNLAAGWVSMRFGARGPIGAPATACAAGAQAIGEAVRHIRRGDATVMIAGGSESLMTPLVFAAFGALRALSTRNDEPTRASRPFDRERDGFVLGEGAGVLVLEELEAARARGAHVYSEIAGYAVTSDAYHPTAPSVDGPADAMTRALADADVSPGEIGYINAHGSSTRHNDVNETKAIKRVFGAQTAVAVSSTKSMTGHMLGAAGAVEAIATLLAIEDGVLPPTVNYETPDPECDLDYVPNAARSVGIDAAMSNSFAFGGTNVSLVFRRVNP